MGFSVETTTAVPDLMRHSSCHSMPFFHDTTGQSSRGDRFRNHARGGNPVHDRDIAGDRYGGHLDVILTHIGQGFIPNSNLLPEFLRALGS